MAYRGISAKIPLGELGLYTDLPQDKLPPNALVWAKNISLFNGNVQKAPGGLRWNSSALPAGIVGVYDWWPNTVTQRLIAVTSTGSIYRGRDRAFESTAMTSGLGTLNPNCVFCAGGNEVALNPKKLFLFTNGVAQVQVLSGDGTEFEAIASPSVDWTTTNFPKFGVIHRNRLWAFAGQFSYASDTGNHENFTTNYLAQSVFPGEGGELKGAFVFKGRLFAFKDGGFVYYLNDADVDSDNWYWQKLASNFGLSAPNALSEVLNDMIAGNTTGTLTSYMGTDSLGDVESADLMRNMQFETFLRATTSKSGLNVQHVLYYPEKKLLFATYRSSYYTYNDTLIVIDYGTPTPRPTYWSKGTPQCLTLVKDVNEISRPAYGDKDGYVVLMDQEDRLEGGSAYLGDFQIPHIDFSYMDPKLSAANKNFDWLAVTYVPEGNHNLSCDYFIDGKFVETITFPQKQYLSNQLSIFELDTDRLAQPNTETVVRPLKGTGRTFSARFYNSGSNESFQVSSITVGFRPGGQGAQKATS